MKINTKLAEGKWVKYNEKVRFKIRAFPTDNLTLLTDEFTPNQVIGKIMCEFSVMDWEGLEDEDGKKFVCDDENKSYILNYYDEIANFLIIEVKKLKNVEPRNVKETSKK
jgi:hypothetical protein